jgi:hypothetical protein
VSEAGPALEEQPISRAGPEKTESRPGAWATVLTRPAPAKIRAASTLRENAGLIVFAPDSFPVNVVRLERRLSPPGRSVPTYGTVAHGWTSRCCAHSTATGGAGGALTGADRANDMECDGRAFLAVWSVHL